MQVIDKTREESEEWFLLEHDPLVFVHIGQYKNKDGQNFREVVDFCLVIVDAGGVPVVLDDVDDQARHCIQSLEGVFKLPGSNALEVAVDAGIGADTEKERRDVLDLQDTLLGELGNVGDKCLLRRVRTLEDGDPLLEPGKELLPELLSLGFDRWLPNDNPIRSDGVARPSHDTTEVVEQTLYPMRST